ncbi:hypothetical protein [Butyrivibrio proteoclasticus]|uniref:hypothetical protein n=1 Tax=Butyrivibrio proteoclasticus TaxID=43305 RepID=UPI0005A608D7|nr:hypothetical protein [Butyrivibrio proteoclasticus]
MTNTKVTVHLGNNYSSVKEMCKYYGIDASKMHIYPRREYSFEKALTIPKKKSLKNKAIDKCIAFLYRLRG